MERNHHQVPFSNIPSGLLARRLRSCRSAREMSRCSIPCGGRLRSKRLHRKSVMKSFARCFGLFFIRRPVYIYTMEHSSKLSSSDIELAHGLARLALGLNILAHGLSRIGDISGFAATIEKMFAATWLPYASVAVTAYAIPPVELIVGALLVLGLFLRPALVIGTLLLCQLSFGSALTQQWDSAGIQLVYVAIYTVLLATAGFDRYSMDRLLRKSALALTPESEPESQ